MRYLIILLFLVSCGYQVMPDTTTVEYGTSENGKNKTTKGIKQTFKWALRLNGVNTKWHYLTWLLKLELFGLD